MYLHVNCRSCDACLVKSANIKAYELSVTLKRFKYQYFITLTYSNKFVPYIQKGYNYVFRDVNLSEDDGDEVLPDVLGPIEDNIDWSLNYKNLTNHPNKNAIGVIWSPDVQLWLKRFRKYIGKHYGTRTFKYFAVFEYGSFYGRPHAHVVIMSNDLIFEECQNACFETWHYHDWNRFWKDGANGNRVNECCKRVKEDGGNVAGYISSYVNCNSSNIKISLYKQFRQKTCRSKEIDFGLDPKIYEQFKADVVRLSSRVDDTATRKVFYFLHKDKKDNISFRLIPTRYICSCFAKFKGYNEISFSGKLSRAYHIVKNVEHYKALGRSLNYKPDNDYSIFDRLNCGFSSMDLNFYRSYKRFLKVFGNYTLIDYMFIMDRVWSYYASCMLKEQMKSYEVLGKRDYFLSLIDTKVEDFCEDTRLRSIVPKVGLSLRKLKEVNTKCPPKIYNDLNTYVYDYKKRLLPKHFNDLANIFGYDG